MNGNGHRPDPAHELLRRLDDARSAPGSAVARLLERLRHAPAEHVDHGDPVVGHLQRLRRAFVEAIDELRGLPAIVAPIFGLAALRVRRSTMRARGRADTTTSLAAGFVVNIASAATLVTTLFVGGISGSIAVAVADKAPARSLPSIAQAKALASAPHATGNVVERNARRRASERSALEASLRVPGSSASGSARVAQGDDEIEVTGDVNGWLAPVSPYQSGTLLTIECDTDTVARSKICAAAREALGLIPPPPYGRS